MRMMMMAALAACMLAVTACISVTNNIGDSAVKAAALSSQGAEMTSTNSVLQGSESNTVATAEGTHSKGGLIVYTAVMKNVSPTTHTTATIPLQ